MEAAIRRFAHFGIQKTSLTEIADDLGMTKQSLMYYFADKQSLQAAVEHLIMEEFFLELENRFAGAAQLEAALFALVDVKRSLYEKYAILMRTAAGESLPPEKQAAARAKARIRLIQCISAVLEQHTCPEALKPAAREQISLLLVDTLNAVEDCTMGRQFLPDPKVLEELSHRQKAVLHLMIHGIREGKWKH
ncbi:MAG TPA: TetR family transcriptional regulator [Chitinophagaceae bacterium]|nr:TetR family transcriptional regulator [Chitinophagaceae bacterium]